MKNNKLPASKKKYIVTDFRNVYQGTFTQKQCEEFFKRGWPSIHKHVRTGERINGLYYIVEEKDMQSGE